MKPDTPALSRLSAGLEPSQIREIGKLADARSGVLKLHFGESSLSTPAFIKTAAERALTDGYTFYTPNAGYTELRTAIAEKVLELHSAPYDPEREIIVTAGGVMAIYLAVHTLVDPGDEVIIISPAWPNIRTIVTLAGAVPVEVPLLCEEHAFRLDLEQVASAVTPLTRAIFVNSPGNPTGWVMEPEEQAALRDFVCARRLMLISDEVYERIVFQHRIAPSMSRLEGLSDRLVVINSFSKTYSMTGWRVGYAAGPADVILAMAQLQEFVVSHAPSVSQRAALTALRNGEDFVDKTRQQYQELRDLACAELNDLDNATFVTPAGTFYLFLRIPQITDSFSFAKDLVLRYGVAVAPGSAFGAGGGRAVRICFGVGKEILTEALARLREAVEQLGVV